jgi:AraC-like DNA-binding protein
MKSGAIIVLAFQAIAHFYAVCTIRETNDPIVDICYVRGYNSWAHFIKQFKQVKRLAPELTGTSLKNS